MKFKNEPAYVHGEQKNHVGNCAVLLCNLGTPDAPTPSAVRRYLAEFLIDHRVVEIPKPIWWLILHGIILRLRPAKSAKKYAVIWTPQGSPLMVWSQLQADMLQKSLDDAGHHVAVRLGMRYGNISIKTRLDELKAEGFTKILVLPMYPQYSGTTTASVLDAVYNLALKIRRIPELRFVNHYHDDPRYIDALAARISAHWAQHGRGEKLVMSFHGVPQRTLLLGDTYHCECYKTARLVAEKLALSKDDYLVTFQSRFGKAKWLEPYTEPSIVKLAQDGAKRLDIICPGFTVDCLETLEEINMEVRDAFFSHGGKQMDYIPCLNDSAQWADGLFRITAQHLSGWDTRSTPDAHSLHIQGARAKALGAAN